MNPPELLSMGPAEDSLSLGPAEDRCPWDQLKTIIDAHVGATPVYASCASIGALRCRYQSTSITPRPSLE